MMCRNADFMWLFDSIVRARQWWNYMRCMHTKWPVFLPLLMGSIFNVDFLENEIV